MRHYITEDRSVDTNMRAPNTRRCLNLKDVFDLTDFSSVEMEMIADMELDQEMNMADFIWIKRVA